VRGTGVGHGGNPAIEPSGITDTYRIGVLKGSICHTVRAPATSTSQAHAGSLRKIASGCALDAFLFSQWLEDELIAAIEHGHPRPSAMDRLQDLPPLDRRLLAGMLGRRLDLDKFPHVLADISENTARREDPEQGILLRAGSDSVAQRTWRD
jgi:hypothetical protein